jgi:DnaJ like chaperone protein
MAWWGTLIGGTLGYMFGGPLGALLGAALGRNFDHGIALGDSPQYSSGDTERVQAAFFTATFSVMGHIAKSDGQVTHDEIATARHIMQQMQLNAAQREAAMRLFNEGKNPGFPLLEVLAQFKRECHRRRNLIQMFLEIQIATVLADARIHQTERALLHHIGAALGFDRDHIEQLFHVAGGAHKASPQQALQEAYAVLGASPADTDDVIKKAYRRLMNQHHPDKLVAKGLPEEMLKIATEKAQEIQKAYELIKQHRQ